MEKVVMQCRAFPSADIGSDHQVVLCHITLKIKSKNAEDSRRVIRYDVEKLKDSRNKLKIDDKLKSKLGNMEENYTDK
jgi:hypothetical protein